jgi:hypothetical protein
LESPDAGAAPGDIIADAGVAGIKLLVALAARNG